jgi:adenylate kinase
MPDEIIVQIIEKTITEDPQANGFLFAGFPRMLVQSYILDELLKKHGSHLSKVIEIEVGTLELIRRLDERSKTNRCMPCDNSTAPKSLA